MSQRRYWLDAPEKEARRLYALLDFPLEDRGISIAVHERELDDSIWQVSIYGDEGEQNFEQVLTSLLSEAGETDIHFQYEVLADIDWVEHSLKGLSPVRSGRFLIHGRHDRHQIRSGDTAIEIEANRAFGTGHHATTEGCLSMIEAVLKKERPRSVLDLGTGSGVLAIAMAKLLRTKIAASDIDPLAVKIATENADKNGTGIWIKPHVAKGFGKSKPGCQRPYDLIVANVLARPLMQLAPGMKRHLAGNGSLILSGILAGQRRAVLASYANHGLYHRKTLWENGWVTLHLKPS